jgi:hypothetical protein
VSSDLPTTGRLIDVSSPDIKLQRAGSALVVSGPMESSTCSTCWCRPRILAQRALHLKFTTITKLSIGSEFSTASLPLQQFSVSARNSGDEGLAGKSWDLRLGFLLKIQFNAIEGETAGRSAILRGSTLVAMMQAADLRAGHNVVARRECRSYLGRHICAGSWVGMPRIIMNRAFIARSTRMPHSIGRLSASAPSHHGLSSAGFHHQYCRI